MLISHRFIKVKGAKSNQAKDQLALLLTVFLEHHFKRLLLSIAKNDRLIKSLWITISLGYLPLAVISEPYFFIKDFGGYELISMLLFTPVGNHPPGSSDGKARRFLQLLATVSYNKGLAMTCLLPLKNQTSAEELFQNLVVIETNESRGSGP